MTKRHLYLIRRGQYRSEGSPATEVLTALGRRQADRLGRRLETRQRMDRAFERYFRPSRRERHELIVAHGNVIRYLVRRAIGDAAHRWWQLDLQQCGLSIVQVPTGGRILRSFNDVGHLPPRMQTFL